MKTRNIKSHIDLKLLDFLRYKKLVMIYVKEVSTFCKQADIRDFGERRIGLHIFPWELTIQGVNFWRTIEQQFMRYKHNERK